MSQADLIKELRKELARILKAYAKDKKFYRITILCLIAFNILTAWKGKEAVEWVWDVVKDKLPF